MFERIKEWVRYQKVKVWFEKHERLLIPGALVLGVIVDYVTFRAIQIETTFIVLGVYCVLAGCSIALMNMESSHRWMKYATIAAPMVLQFTLGALLSASLIFYWFSGSLSVSWPLLLVLVVLMTSNEVLRHYYLRPAVQLSVYYFALFSISTLLFPYVFNTIERWVFLFGGGVSLVVMFAYLVLLSRRSTVVRAKRSLITISVLLILIAMNALYVFNIIPPIPLSLREAGVYHNVERVRNGYRVIDEEKPFIERLFPVQTIHVNAYERVYVFTSIFAPSDLHTEIVHHWQFFHPGTRTWVDEDRLSFQVSGGREGGYRGYSLKSTLHPGRHRVRVETPQGQVLGTIRFEVETPTTPVQLIEVLK